MQSLPLETVSDSARYLCIGSKAPRNSTPIAISKAWACARFRGVRANIWPSLGRAFKLGAKHSSYSDYYWATQLEMSETVQQRPADDATVHRKVKRKCVRKIPQSRQRGPLRNVEYVRPTDEEKQRRKAYVDELQEQAKWCKLCDLARPIKNHKARTKHRQKVHGVGPEPPIMIPCELCDREVQSKGYSRHVCPGKDPVKLAMVACPKCGSMYSKYGIKNHQYVCYGRLSTSLTDSTSCDSNDPPSAEQP